MDVDALDRAAHGDGLAMRFQPVVDLDGGHVVGYEALARWPGLEVQPDRVFGHAAAYGRLGELDARCLRSALDVALREGSPEMFLMVNTEPDTPYPSPSAKALLDHAGQRLRLLFELTERALLAHPRTLLEKVTAIRSDGFGIALDDVGSRAESLALLDILRPDVIKLDCNLVQSTPNRSRARTLTAIMAHQERTGAVVLAEGIENDEHLEQAIAVGASLGQGFHFGGADTLAAHPFVTAWQPPVNGTVQSSASDSAFATIAAADVPIRTARKKTVMALTRHVERIALNRSDPPVMLCGVQSARNMTGVLRRKYRRIAATSPLVAVFGTDVEEDLGDGVRGVALAPGDPLRSEWVVLALGTHVSVALVARVGLDQPAEPSDAGRRYDFVITQDRDAVTAAARMLFDRML